jgi:protein SCO1/2
LGRQAEKVQVIMVSVDPERDTPEKVSQYARRFNGAFLGLTGTPDEIARIAAVFGIFYEKEEVDSAAGYLVTHTASTMVLNEQGRLVLIWPFGVTADEVAADLQHLVR